MNENERSMMIGLAKAMTSLSDGLQLVTLTDDIAEARLRSDLQNVVEQLNVVVNLMGKEWIRDE